MANYSLSVCLNDLDGMRTQKSADGKLYVCLPVEEADIYLSNKGKFYLSLNMWERRGGTDQYGHTHNIKQSLSQARRDALGEAAKNKPYLGNAKEIKPKGSMNPSDNVYNQQPPQGYEQPAYQQAANPAQAPDDLPF